MKVSEYDKHVKAFTDEMISITNAKNPDYSRTKESDDAMGSFKAIAERINLSPLQVWHVLMSKHMAAIETYIQTGELKSESIHGRFLDLANYMMLGDALVRDLATPSTVKK